MTVMPVERTFVSKYSKPTFAIEIYRDGAPGAADGTVEASWYPIGAEGPAEDPAWTREALPVAGEPGTYALTLTGADTSVLGDYELRFTYEVAGSPEIYGYDVQVGPAARTYDAMPAAWSGIVDRVWLRFADLFDSPYGGPNLQVYIQTHFGRERLAQLMPAALQTLNNVSMPHKSFEVNGTDFDFAAWGGLLERSLYIEVLKHLVRSYVEQPEVILGTAVSRVDRRDYMQRWQEVLNSELQDFNRDLSRYKMAYLGLGNVHVLVSGGAFGNMGPYMNAGGAGEAAARGYFAIRRWH